MAAELWGEVIPLGKRGEEGAATIPAFCKPAAAMEVAAQNPKHLPCPSGYPRYLTQGWDCQKGNVGFIQRNEIDRRLEKKLKITQKESRKSKSPPKVPMVIQDDSLPPGPPPQIRILKRPTTNGVLSTPSSAPRPPLPVKSLAQREAEYAEARKRILGSASPEEEQEKPILDRPPRISQPEDTRQPNNVIRQPLGPDGSQGFRHRR